MSIDTATLERIEQRRSPKVKGFQVTCRPETKDLGSLAWRQINDLLCASLRDSGFPQPVGTSAPGLYAPLEISTTVVVAPGIVVDGDEYERRYGSVDLEQCKRQMSPELFKAFVRHIGCIPGTPDLDLGDIVTTPE